MHKRLILFAIGAGLASASVADPPTRFNAQLFGFNAGGEPIPTNATGHATVEILDDNTAVYFQVQVAGIQNLFMAHIHVAPEAVQITDPAGPIVFWFTGGPPPSETVTKPVNGTLARGFIMTDSQVVGPPGLDTVEDLISAIRDGRASVVVHTNDLDPETPTGRAGDSAAGEIRGTLR